MIANLGDDLLGDLSLTGPDLPPSLTGLDSACRSTEAWEGEGAKGGQIRGLGCRSRGGRGAMAGRATAVDMAGMSLHNRSYRTAGLEPQSTAGTKYEYD